MTEPSTDEGLPIFDESPLRSLAVDRQAIRPRSRRAALLALAWASGLVALVGIATLTRERDQTPGAEIAAGTGVSTTLPGFGWPPESRTFHSVVSLDRPAPEGEIRSRRLAITGTMTRDAEQVRVALEGRQRRLVDVVWIDVVDPDGGIRPARTPTFAASFELPTPRPTGTMWVVVTAYDERGAPLGAIRRAFGVGPLLSPGVWGGSLPAGPQWCIPVGTVLATSC